MRNKQCAVVGTGGRATMRLCVVVGTWGRCPTVLLVFSSRDTGSAGPPLPRDAPRARSAPRAERWSHLRPPLFFWCRSGDEVRLFHGR